MSAALPTKDPCIGGKHRKRPGGPPYSSRLATQTVAEFYPRRSKPNLDKSEEIYNSVTRFSLVPDELVPLKSCRIFPNAHSSSKPTAQNRRDDTRSPSEPAVKILGSNLTGSTNVTFNGTNAAFKVASSLEVTTTVPAGASSGKVKVVIAQRHAFEQRILCSSSADSALGSPFSCSTGSLRRGGTFLGYDRIFPPVELQTEVTCSRPSRLPPPGRFMGYALEADERQPRLD